MIGRLLSRWCMLALALVAVLVPGSALACTVASPAAATLGPYSPAAIRASAVPVLATPSSINCGNSVISLASGNSFTATVTSPTAFKITATGVVEQASFQVYADAAGTKPFTPGVAMNFLNTGVIDVVGLLGSSPASIPLYVKPVSTALLPPGTYGGSFRVAWSWKFCSGAWVGSSCTLGTIDSGSGTADIAFQLVVAARPITAAVTSKTSWDPVSGTSFPKAIIGSKRRLTVTVANPDIVAADLNTVSVELATPAGTSIALTGDGSGSGGTVVFTDGSPASGLSFRYGSGADATDDVSFFDATLGWSYAPTAGDAASEAAVLRVRLRPRGSMAAGSSFVISLPYLVK